MGLFASGRIEFIARVVSMYMRGRMMEVIMVWGSVEMMEGGWV